MLESEVCSQTLCRKTGSVKKHHIGAGFIFICVDGQRFYKDPFNVPSIKSWILQYFCWCSLGLKGIQVSYSGPDVDWSGPAGERLSSLSPCKDTKLLHTYLETLCVSCSALFEFCGGSKSPGRAPQWGGGVFMIPRKQWALCPLSTVCRWHDDMMLIWTWHF